MTKEDYIYAQPQNNIPPFDFNAAVVDVFDDMLTRSVPLYHESIRRQAQLAAEFYQPGTTIYDLGCSNGNFAMRLLKEMGTAPFTMQAVDNSQPMLEQYRTRLATCPTTAQITLHNSSIEDFPLQNASVVVINLTLQFIAVQQRRQVLQRVYDALVPGGVLLLSEKIVAADEQIDQIQQRWYYRFKGENGYSQLEISQKREALENVLIPDTVEQHRQRLHEVGFRCCDIWLKWFNFMSMLCIRP